MSYDIIVTDPPWKFSSNSEAKPGRNAMRHYPCVADEKLAAMPLQKLLKPDALVFVWTTVPMLVRSLKIVDAWGLKYVSEIVWVKDKIGTGFWVRNRHEIIMVCKRGKFLCPKPAPFADSVIEAPRGKHSEKPEALQDMIDKVWPDAAKLEMFARRPREGWSVWGNQSGGAKDE